MSCGLTCRTADTRYQTLLREDGRAGYSETSMSGSEGSSVKPGMVTCQGARCLPYKQLVRLKWTYRHRNAGRPRTDKASEQLVLRLARENDWGYERIEGVSTTKILRRRLYKIQSLTEGRLIELCAIEPAIICSNEINNLLINPAFFKGLIALVPVTTDV